MNLGFLCPESHRLPFVPEKHPAKTTQRRQTHVRHKRSNKTVCYTPFRDEA